MRSIDEIWRLAREDADFAPDEARVYLLPGTKRGDYWAMYFKPGDWLVFDENFPFSDNQLQDADGPRLMTHRVAVYAGVQEPELAGLMRHELEHAAQQRRFGDASWRIYRYTIGALFRQYGSRPGSGTIYNSVPIERDANAAAAAHVVPTYGPLPQEIVHGEHSVLFRFPDGPLPLDSLAVRSLAFAAVHAGAFQAELAGHSDTFDTSPQDSSPMHLSVGGTSHRTIKSRSLQRSRSTRYRAILRSRALPPRRQPRGTPPAIDWSMPMSEHSAWSLKPAVPRHDLPADSVVPDALPFRARGYLFESASWPGRAAES